MKLDSTFFHRSKHLDEPDLEPPGSQCPFCASTNRTPCHQLQENPRISLLKCHKCHAATASRTPTSTALEYYYKQYYLNSERITSAHITFDDPQKLANHLLKHLAFTENSSSFSILDFGGGDGAIARTLANRIDAKPSLITVVDFEDEHPVSRAKDPRIRFSRDLRQVPGSFDLVLASAVIEHLPAPGPVLDDLLARLNPGGFFYSRTPCVFPLMKLASAFGIPWDFTYPAHIHDLGQAFWEGYFRDPKRRDAFEVVESRPSLVESTFRKHFFRTLAAYALKSPWWLLGRRYQLVGGWQILAQRPGGPP